MKPVLSVEEMRAVDEATQSTTPIAVLIERAGASVARVAIELLGGAYGRRVVVIAGKGHNGDDGRVAARHLARRGIIVTELDPTALPARLPDAELVIDAAYGTGFRGDYAAPLIPSGAKVLSVDIPSGLSGNTGAGAGAVRADATVTFGSLKPGLLLGDGPDHAGVVTVAGIGLSLGAPQMALIEDADVTRLVPRRSRAAHKWQRAVYVVAGSPGMLGAAELASRAALRSGSGMVRLGSPGATPGEVPVTEVVARPLSAIGFSSAVLDELDRCAALVLGPGLGQRDGTASEVRHLVDESPVPVVLDADGLNALAPLPASPAAKRRASLILTPHDGEYARLAGAPVGEDRVAAARALALRSDAVVLLKGPTTIVADPLGAVRFVNSGSARLATAGTGDVLSGVIGALLARGLDPLHAAALGAHLHGRAAALGYREGLVAGDLPELLARVLSDLESDGGA